MDKIERIVDQVMAAWKQRLTIFPNGFSLAAWEGAVDDLGPWRARITDEVLRTAAWSIDRADLLARVRDTYEDDYVDFAAVQSELEALGQAKLADTLISEGMNPEDAKKAMACFTLGAHLEPPR